ncbi:Clr5 domain-containing protein [Pseudomassariella vexata]|uniref:Clr5 domain-domain-containing protein n=1 Tax=Pseudomassariella vexata TaxID=1141098 RepID=A0A1Y2DAU5_9PEZI|nr:Clr5 domain-containing protein [Pseudomassariella vexata]ORY56388.1 Clr5 domain-domain-containing protein [Pseudomassariella vexata]
MIPPSLTSRRNWATPMDWESYRARIINLYIDQKMPLRSVMQHMRDRHHFHATEKMYKMHFVRWRVRKNFKKWEIDDLVRHQQQSQPPLELGKTHRCQLLSTSCRTPSPDPPISILFPLSTPETLHQPEHFMRLTTQYITWGFNSGSWQANPPPLVMSASYVQFRAWFDDIIVGKQLLLLGNTKQAFAVFQSSTDKYARIVLGKNPRLMIYTYITALFLIDVAPDLVRSIINHAVDLCRVVHPNPAHPLRLLMELMTRTSFADFRRSARHVLHCYFHQIEANVEASTWNTKCVTKLRAPISNILATEGLLDFEQAECTLKMVLRRSCKEGHTAEPVDEFNLTLLQTRLDLASLYLRWAKLDEAHTNIAEAVDSEEIRKHPFCVVQACLLLISIARKQGSQKRVLSLVPKVAKLCLQHGRESDGVTVTALNNLESYLREVGQIKEADCISRDLDAVATASLYTAKLPFRLASAMLPVERETNILEAGMGGAIIHEGYDRDRSDEPPTRYSCSRSPKEENLH